MKEELQGEGTYDYQCDGIGCYHCFLLNKANYKPIIEPVILSKPRPIKTIQPILAPIIKVKQRRARPIQVWEPWQLAILKENWFVLSRRQLSARIGIGEHNIKRKALELNLGVKNKVHELSHLFINESILFDNFGGWF